MMLRDFVVGTVINAEGVMELFGGTGKGLEAKISSVQDTRVKPCMKKNVRYANAC